MPTRSLGRLAAALVVACGLALAAATPASATTVPLSFEPGSVLNVGALTADLGGVSSGNVCAANGTQNSIAPDITGGVIDLDVADWTTYARDITIGFNTFQIQVVPTADTTGTISGSNVYLDLSYKVVVKNCAGTVTLCETRTISHPVSETSPYTGSNPPVSGDTMSLGGASYAPVTAPPSCNNTIRAFLTTGSPTVLLLELQA